MLGLGLVRPLEDDWRDTLDAAAAARGWPTTRDPRRLAERVAALSAAYNDATRARAAVRDAGAARLAFSFVRDVPKGAAAVRELLAVRAFAHSAPGAPGAGAARTIRLLDVGAGLGAMTWGIARAFDAAGARVAVDATWVDADREALDVGRAILAARGSRAGDVELSVRYSTGAAQTIIPGGTHAIDAVAPPGAFDIVVVGQLLSELDVGEADDVRVERHAAWLRRLSVACAPGGALVVVEPALRDRTRHLHRVRDALVDARGAVVDTANPGRSPTREELSIFAPCLHEAPCPALAVPGDWCHEDLPIDLPAWLLPIARGAGLRFEGLTFSYLVVRKQGPSLAAILAAETPSGPAGASPRTRLRVVSNPRVTKGKREAFLCGDFPCETHGRKGARPSVARLDRDRSRENLDWERMVRGDIVAVAPPPATSPSRAMRAARAESAESAESAETCARGDPPKDALRLAKTSAVAIVCEGDVAAAQGE